MYYSSDAVSGWSQTTRLTAADVTISDNFGLSVAVFGNNTVVGAYNDDSGAGSVPFNNTYCIEQRIIVSFHRISICIQ